MAYRQESRSRPMEKTDENDGPQWTDEAYLAWATDAIEEYAAGEGVVVKVITPPAGKGPTRWIVLVDGIAQPPPSAMDFAIARANRLAASRKQGRESGSGSGSGSTNRPII